MDKKEKAIELFNSGFNCAQSVLSSYSDKFGLKIEDALKISCGFGAGISRMQNICGAVSAAFMVIGLAKGNIDVDNGIFKEETYRLVQFFTMKFKEKHQTILCRELLKCKISSPEGMEYFKEKNLFNKICVPCVRDAVEILDKIIY